MVLFVFLQGRPCTHTLLCVGLGTRAFAVATTLQQVQHLASGAQQQATALVVVDVRFLNRA